MKIATPRLALGFVSFLLFAQRAAVPADGVGEPVVRLTPERIEMGSFYSGARLRIEGMVGPGSKAIVVVRGSDRKESFNTKARFGLIWATSGKVEISGGPSLFLCFSPEPVSALLDAGVIRRSLLDEASILTRLRVDPEQAADTAGPIRSHFLDLKKADGLYQVFPQSLKMGEPRAGGTPFSVEFLWPKLAPPASYTVKVLECRDRAVSRESSVPLQVVKVGFPESFAVLANQHAPLYGILAVLAAASAGFAIDFLASRLFGRKRRVAH